MMLAPSVAYDIDLIHASEILVQSVLRASEEMVEFMFDGIKLTLYANGSLMFYHFNDPDAGYDICDRVLPMVTKV
ncbi:MAG: hypothetical protein J6R75_03125 [Candidatus Methanomethylophilaceae archaeon]|nr:hypothetical protein [Candidatus Methanomethylophilaceae archaeon]